MIDGTFICECGGPLARAEGGVYCCKCGLRVLSPFEDPLKHPIMFKPADWEASQGAYWPLDPPKEADA